MASCLALSSCDEKEPVEQEAAPIEVSALRIERADIPLTMEFVGQTKGAVDAEIRARVEGVVTAVHFEEGKEVREGQLLYSIDPLPYRAKVAGAQGKLAEAKTALVKAESDLQRIRPLVQMKAMSERDLDRAVAQEGAARGSVEAAEAALEAAEIELGYCEIASPTTGVIGHTKAKVGEFVGRPPNPVVLNTVSKLDPIHAAFSVSEKDYLHFARLEQEKEQSGIERSKRQVRMILADGSTFPERGEIVSVGRAVDPASGTIPIEASFPNPRKLIRPGQFAKVVVDADIASGVIAVPKRAVREIQGQYQVVVVKPDNTVETRNVVVGREVGEKQIVESGLADEEVIVTEGLQRLQAGMPVIPKVEG